MGRVDLGSVVGSPLQRNGNLQPGGCRRRNRVRSARMRFGARPLCAGNRAQLKRDLKAGRCAIEEVLSDPPVFVQSAKVADLLLALPKYGPVKVNKLLSRCRIAPSKTIGSLSDRQRNELAALLAD
jgi:S13-like H2TH domain